MTMRLSLLSTKNLYGRIGLAAWTAAAVIWYDRAGILPTSTYHEVATSLKRRGDGLPKIDAKWWPSLTHIQTTSSPCAS